MNRPLTLLLKLFVRTFYRQNAGAFIFFLTIMFGAVGQLKGAGIVEYHYSLISGMLANKYFFMLVLVLWLLYARKCAAFIVSHIHRPEYSFLHILTRKNKYPVFNLFIVVQLLVFAPIWIYAILILAVAFSNHWHVQGIVIAAFLFGVIFYSANFYTNILFNTGKEQRSRQLPRLSSRYNAKYPVILLRYIMRDQAVMFMGIKLYSCAILWLLSKNNTPSDYDPYFPFIFFSFGVFAHIMIISRLRQFEETRLLFYRSFAVKLGKRFLQYILLYFILFLPEILTIIRLAPHHLYYTDVINYILGGFALVLTLHSLSYSAHFTMKEYLKISFLFFFAVFLFTAMRFLPGVYLSFLPTAFLLFFRGYKTYERI